MAQAFFGLIYIHLKRLVIVIYFSPHVLVYSKKANFKKASYLRLRMLSDSMNFGRMVLSLLIELKLNHSVYNCTLKVFYCSKTELLWGFIRDS